MSAAQRKPATRRRASTDALVTTAAILCDDIRREVSGKEILIGVYSGSILVPSFPAALTLALWLEHQPQRAGTLPFAVRLATDRGTVLFSAEMELEIIAADEPATLGFGGIRVLLTDPCELRVETQESGGPWHVVKRKQVARRPEASPGPP